MKTKLYLLLILLLANQNSSGADNYFPDKTFSENQSNNDFIVGWYSKHLAALNEDSLWKSRGSQVLSVYRFLSLPTWGNPTSITFTLHEDGTGKIIVKRTDGQGGYDPGKLVINKAINLDKSGVGEILNQFKKLDFWKLPVKDEIYGLDGVQWIIEGVKDGQYHIVDRWSPKSGDFYDTCILLFKMADLKPKL